MLSVHRGEEKKEEGLWMKTYGPSSPARDSASLKTSDAMLTESGEGAASLCQVEFVSRTEEKSKTLRSTYPGDPRPISKAISGNRTVLDRSLGKLPEAMLNRILAALKEHGSRPVSMSIHLGARTEQMDLIFVLVDPVPLARRRHPRVQSAKCERASREQHNDRHER